MAEDHNFNVGQPDNIVFSNEFLDTLQGKLDNSICLYCEKDFKYEVWKIAKDSYDVEKWVVLLFRDFLYRFERKLWKKELVTSRVA